MYYANFAGAIGSCIAEGVKGQDVVAATSLGTSICSVAGVWDPLDGACKCQSSLSAAATAVPSSSDNQLKHLLNQLNLLSLLNLLNLLKPHPNNHLGLHLKLPNNFPNITSAPDSPPAASSSSNPHLLLIELLPLMVLLILTHLQNVLKAMYVPNTGITPCPYWDAGCLCVMPQFAGAIGSCVADRTARSRYCFCHQRVLLFVLLPVLMPLLDASS